MRRLLTAIQFLTIVPVGRKFMVGETDIAKSSSLFVPVGLIQGLLLIAVDNAASRIFERDLSTGLVLLALVIANGGFHLDGLADTFDAIAAKGDKEKKLSIMKDGTIGPIGVTAVFFVLLLKFLALKSLTSFSRSSALILMPAFSKWAMVVSMFYGRPARHCGLGRIFIGNIGIKEVVLSTFILLLSCAASQTFFAGSALHERHFSYAIPAMIVYLICRFSIRFSERQFGGLTGDTIGAIGEISEACFLLTVIAWT